MQHSVNTVGCCSKGACGSMQMIKYFELLHGRKKGCNKKTGIRDTLSNIFRAKFGFLECSEVHISCHLEMGATKVLWNLTLGHESSCFSCYSRARLESSLILIGEGISGISFLHSFKLK